MTRTEVLSDIVDMNIPPVREVPNSLVIYTDGSWAEDEPYAGKQQQHFPTCYDWKLIAQHFFPSTLLLIIFPGSLFVVCFC